MEGSLSHSGDEDSDDDVELTLHNTFLCVSARNRGRAVLRSKSWSDSSSSRSQVVDPNLLFRSRNDDASSSFESNSLSDAARPQVTHGDTCLSVESGALSDAHPEVTVIASASGDLPSAGALLHESGSCRPCRFLSSADGCRLGEQCSSCHHPEHALVAKGKIFRRPSKCVRKALKKRMCEIAESNMSDDMKKEAYARLAGENAYVGRLLKNFHPDGFAGDSESKEAAGVSAAAGSSGASAASSMAPAAQPRIPGLQPGGQRIAARCAPVVPGMLSENVPEAQNTTKVSL
eukprot:TRINITY_DN18084_c1_g1_i4.p1 TRINITY_DN18084_c1_g1~~TRINITY_DN18084_c1_g1_i4.p1  ORF type:complete len:290 (-),score=44.01 TRINITY_DN18084_c1_g1_i4:122-991(-)